MAPLVAASVISLGSTLLGGLFGRRRTQSQPTGPDVFIIQGAEGVKDNSTLYLIVGLVAIVLLIIVSFLIVKSIGKNG